MIHDLSFEDRNLQGHLQDYILDGRDHDVACQHERETHPVEYIFEKVL
jgi:hypothetical protein